MYKLEDRIAKSSTSIESVSTERLWSHDEELNETKTNVQEFIVSWTGEMS